MYKILGKLWGEIYECTVFFTCRILSNLASNLWTRTKKAHDWANLILSSQFAPIYGLFSSLPALLSLCILLQSFALISMYEDLITGNPLTWITLPKSFLISLPVSCTEACSFFRELKACWIVNMGCTQASHPEIFFFIQTRSQARAKFVLLTCDFYCRKTRTYLSCCQVLFHIHWLGWRCNYQRCSTEFEQWVLEPISMGNKARKHVHGIIDHLEYRLHFLFENLYETYWKLIFYWT